jgi:hypothetical protein
VTGFMVWPPLVEETDEKPPTPAFDKHPVEFTARGHGSAFSRHEMPEPCATFHPQEVEGAGKAGCALHPRSRVQMHIGKRTRAYRFSGGNPAFPAQWF